MFSKIYVLKPNVFLEVFEFYHRNTNNVYRLFFFMFFVLFIADRTDTSSLKYLKIELKKTTSF